MDEHTCNPRLYFDHACNACVMNEDMLVETPTEPNAEMLEAGVTAYLRLYERATPPEVVRRVYRVMLSVGRMAALERTAKP